LPLSRLWLTWLIKKVERYGKMGLAKQSHYIDKIFVGRFFEETQAGGWINL
jgi:hypothetical protein